MLSGVTTRMSLVVEHAQDPPKYSDHLQTILVSFEISRPVVVERL